jgi:hypothetical protein
MIRYTLTCNKDHEFEGWFANSSAYDDQASRGLVTCPHCGSVKISKAPMAPGVAGTKKSYKSKSKKEIVDALRLVREHVIENADNVGDQFASEARKIHNEEAEPRGIYGKATTEEAEALSEEGVEFHPLPTLPEDHN